MFCPQTFSSAIEKDDHTLEHFAQEMCTECNRNLIRIGNNLYTLHTTATCANNKKSQHQQKHEQHSTDEQFKSESPIEINNEIWMQFDSENCANKSVFGSDEYISEPATAVQNLDNFKIKLEFETSSIQEESQMEIENKMEVNNDDASQDNNDDKHSWSHISAECNLVDSRTQSQIALPSDTVKEDTEKISSKEECDICGKFYNALSLQQHKTKKHDYCIACSTTFANKAEFNQHKRSCTEAKKNAENTHCSICNLLMKTRKPI